MRVCSRSNLGDIFRIVPLAVVLLAVPVHGDEPGLRAGGGAGASFVRQQYESGGGVSAVSFMAHARLEYGARFRYVGRYSYGVPLYAWILGEQAQLDRDSPTSVATDTFHGAAMVFSPGDNPSQGGPGFTLMPAVGVGANLTYVVPEDQDSGPAPVTGAGPALEGSARLKVGERLSFELSAGALVGLLTVDMAEDSFDPSGVDVVYSGHLSPGIMLSF